MMPMTKVLFRQVKTILDSSVSEIKGVESQLYSDKLKIAGSTDLIGNYLDKRSIIDYKNSAKDKLREYIHGYFLQTALYSYMWHERTGLYHPQLVVIIAVESSPQAQVFVEDVNDWIDTAFDCCKLYHRNNP